jgi:predicted nucleic acid-binding protein
MVRGDSPGTSCFGTETMMLHLDTNYLIGLVTSPFPLKPQVLAWFNAGETLAISAIAWSEFLNGPVTPQERRDAFGMVEGRIRSFDVREAEMAANLFNLTGRKRATQTDCFIAATAICAGTPFATLNRKDFASFVTAGLRLA